MKRLFLTLTVLGLSACVVGPDYKAPETPAPQKWSEAQGERVASEPADLARWWTAFGDAELDSLVERATAANLDLKLAAARVREARAEAGFARAELAPELDVTAGSHHRRTSQTSGAPLAHPESNLYDAGFDASWEIDVFGGKERGVEAATAELEASVEDRRAVLVSLLGEVASAYVELRGNQRSAAVARGNIAAARDALELRRARLDSGLATALDVSRAEALLASTQASLPQYEAGARVAMHRLATLLAVQPETLHAELEAEAAIPAPPEKLLVGLPSELLRRRPDLRRAERQLAAATARIGAAMADRYPKFSLTSSFGLESSHSDDFTDAASRAFSIGPALRWPLFDGGRIAANIEIQDARAEQALQRYQQSLFLALEEVENALVGYLREWDHRRALQDSAKASRHSYELADDLNRNGMTDFLDVLDAQRTLYQAELDLAGSETDVTLKVVALYKALGGGWESEAGQGG